MRILSVFLFIALSFIWVTGCKSDGHDTGHEGTEHHQTDGKLDLKLNNGKRWIANPETETGFGQIEVLLESFNADEGHVLSDYNELGANLQVVVDGIIQECTMEGQGHDELHKLLVPMIEEVKILKGNDVAACQEAIVELERLTALYSNYFQLSDT